MPKTIFNRWQKNDSKESQKGEWDWVFVKASMEEEAFEVTP